MAPGAFDDGKRTMELGLPGILKARKIIRKRLGAEIKERNAKRRVAIAAGFPSVLFKFHKLP